MSNLFNPYALTVLGKPLQQRQSPELRVETPYITRAQLDMAQHTFVRFLDQARLSRVPNPTQQGRLADGTPYRIVTASGAPIMQVWPVDENRVRPKSKHGILLHYFDEVSKFIIVQYFGEEWKSIDVKSGRCGATIHPSAVKAADGGNLFALTNYGMYEDSVQTETKFGSNGVSEPHPSSAGTFIFNDAILEFGGSGVPVILSEGSLAFVIRDGGEASLKVLKTPQKGSLAEDEVSNIRLPDTPDDIVVYAGEDDKPYGPIIVSPKDRGVLARFRSTQYSVGGDGITTDFCQKLFTYTPDTIPAHRLRGTPYKYDKEVSLKIVRGSEGITLAHSINDISQEKRILDVSSTAEIVEGSKSLLVPWSYELNPNPEDEFHTSGVCAGEMLEDNSELRKPFTVEVFLSSGYLEEDTRKLTKSATYEDDILISSYFDFSGNKKELRMIQKITSSSDSERFHKVVQKMQTWTGRYIPGFPSLAGEMLAELENDGSNVDRKGLETVSSTTNAKYTSVLSVGGRDIDVVDIDGWAKNNYEKKVISGGVYSGPIESVALRLEASVFNILSFEELSETVVGVRVRAKTNGEEDIPIIRLEGVGDTVYFNPKLKFETCFEVYHKGELVFSEELKEFERSISMTSFSLTMSRTNGYFTLPPEYITEQSNSGWIPTYITDYTVGSESIPGACPLFKRFYKPRTTNYQPERHTFRRHEREYDAKDIQLSGMLMFPGKDATEQFVSASGASELSPPKTMIAVDPTSGGCAVVNEICKILISPDGVVTEIQDVTELPNDSLKVWCASI